MPKPKNIKQKHFFILLGISFVIGVFLMLLFFIYPFYRVDPARLSRECSTQVDLVIGARAAVCGGKTVYTCECRGRTGSCYLWCGSQRNGCDWDSYGDCSAEFTIAGGCTYSCRVTTFTNESILCSSGGSPTPPPPPPPPPCVPGACTGCTPRCPSGQSTTVSGSLCSTQRATCRGDDGCDPCTRTGSMCYLPETNVAPNPVSDIQFCTGTSTNCTTLSKNSGSPTIVVNDNAADPVYLKALGGVIPSGSNSRGLRYRWRLDYLGDAYDCANPYDACQNVDTDNISNDVKAQVVEGYTYRIIYWVGTLDRCDGDIKWSSAVTAYFTVDYTPQIVGALLNGQSGTEIDEVIFEGTPKEEVLTNDNNPFTLAVRYRDRDGVDELRVLGFWTDDLWPNSARAPETVHGYVRVNGGGTSYTALGYSCIDGCGWKVNGGTVPAADKVLCTVNGISTDLLASDPRCVNEISAWTVTRVRVVSATDVIVDYKIWIDGDIGDNLNHYIYARDIYGANTRWVDRGDWIHDKEGPTVNLSDELTIIGSNNVSLDWSVTDNLTGVAEIRGDALLITAGLKDSPIDDDTSGVLDFKIDGTETKDLWLVNNPISRTEEIDLKSNEGNQIGFKAVAIDNVGNPTESPTTVQELDAPWANTKGGYVYSADGTVLNTRSLEVPGYRLTRDPVLWEPPFRFHLGNLTSYPQNNDIALATELYLVGSGSNFETLDSTTNPAQGPSVSNVGAGYGDSIYKTLYEGVIRKAEYNISVSPIPITTTVWEGSISSQVGCSGTDEVCVFHRTGNLTVRATDADNPFVCDIPSIIFVEGNLTLRADILRGTDPLDGCIFVGARNVTINRGVNHPNPVGCNVATITDDTICYPPYDELEAMVVSDGQITVDPDVESFMNEGLSVHGSLIGLGESASPGILWQRSLKLANNARFPSLVVHFDPVYLGIINRYTDMLINSYVQDVGYKSY